MAVVSSRPDHGFLTRVTIATAWGEGLDGYDLGGISVVLALLIAPPFISARSGRALRDLSEPAVPHRPARQRSRRGLGRQPRGSGDGHPCMLIGAAILAAGAVASHLWAPDTAGLVLTTASGVHAPDRPLEQLSPTT